MALSGLFILMTQHGLEYPKFYEKLYAVLTPAVFMAKHRSVFLQVSRKMTSVLDIIMNGLIKYLCPCCNMVLMAVEPATLSQVGNDHIIPFVLVSIN
jgi:hypothetical protein